MLKDKAEEGAGRVAPRRVTRLAKSARATVTATRRKIVSSVGRLFRRRRNGRKIAVGVGADNSLGTEALEDFDEPTSISSDEKSLALLTHGSKHLSLLGGIASVKLYDFHILVDAQNLPSQHEHQERRKERRRRGRMSTSRSEVGDTSALSHLFRLPAAYSNSNRLETTEKRTCLPDAKIILYAARDLPLDQLRAELTRVLAARLPPSQDNQKSKLVLDHLLSALSRERLPASALSPSLSHIRSGESLHFVRTDCGGQEEENDQDFPSACRITLRDGGGHQLSEVRSAELSFALFDLFLGENAVSEKARRMAVNQLRKIQERNKNYAISYRHHPS